MQGPTRYEGLGIHCKHFYTVFCHLHGVTSADCVAVITPLATYLSSSASIPYVPHTTTYTLPDSTNIGFAQVPITAMGFRDDHSHSFEGHSHFVDQFQSCWDQYTHRESIAISQKIAATRTTSMVTASSAVSSGASQPPKTATEQHTHGLSQGAKVGVGVGVGIGAVVVIVSLVVYLAARRYRARNRR